MNLRLPGFILTGYSAANFVDLQVHVLGRGCRALMAHLHFPSLALAKGEESAQVQWLSHALNMPQPLSPVPLPRPTELGVVYCVLLLSLKEGALTLATLFISTDAL